MAGVVPRNKITGRKQWTLHDGPRGSLRRLRNQLANSGCSESQYILAKQLLEENCELDIDKKQNAELGVHWLIKASEQGNAEATELLNKCLITGRGITEHNYLDVKSCINMTQDEKIARKAAREMFASLSNGEDFITSEQLQKRMIQIHNHNHIDVASADNFNNELQNGDLFRETDSDTDSNEDWSFRSEKNEKLTEDQLVSAAVNYSHGYLPLVNNVLCLTDPNLNSLDHIPFLQRSIRHPFMVLQIFYYKFVSFFGNKKILSIFNRTDLLLLLLLLHSFFNVENVAIFIPTVLFYGSLLTMIIMTFQMLQTSRDFQDFQVWSGLFLTYADGNFNSEEAEFQFIINNLKPYGHFFLALLINLIVYPIISVQWIPQSEITILGFFLTFITLFSFMVKEKSTKFPDLLLLFSFSVNVLAKYPYEIDPVVTQNWRFLDVKIPTFTNYIIGNGIEFCLNFRLLFYCAIPFIFLYIAARQNWKGTFKFFIPHCVTLSWLQIVVIHSQGATMFGLLRGTLAVVGFILFLPLAGLTTILLPAAATAKWLVANNFLHGIMIFVLVFSVGFAISWILSKTKFHKYVGLVQMTLALVAAYILIISSFNITSLELHSKLSDRTINWEQYQSICHQPAWDNTNIAKTQVYCHELNGLFVNWHGYINEIKLKAVKNNWKHYIDKFPALLRNYLYCFYGESIETCHDSDICYLISDLRKSISKCSLDNLNEYEYEISVRMQSGIWGKSAEVILVVSHAFTNFSMHLKPNDKISFNGVLMNNYAIGADGILGGVKPHVFMKEISCLACHNTNLTYFIPNSTNETEFRKIFSFIYTGLKYVLNTILYPVVVIK